jgi:Ca2+-binding RTX toxin-like protein
MQFRLPARTALGCTICAAAIGIGAVPAQAVDLDGADVQFIMEQIQRAENHAAGGQLAGPGANQIGSPLLPYGLRTVDGSYNNIVPGQEHFGSADRVFPRLVDAEFMDAEPFDQTMRGGPATPTSYKDKTNTFVADSQPRTISNLIVDQTTDNPAANAAAAAHDGSSTEPNPKPGKPAINFLPNRAPDVGLSAPYNSWFTLFGQFFDHGLDLTTKGGSGTVIIPLKPGDELYDPSPTARTNFMVLTRATNQKGPDGLLGTADDIQDATNTTTPYVDQNQTYTSHPSHQVFLREYRMNAAGKTVASGRLLDRPDGGGLARWQDVKDQAKELLGIELDDRDLLNVPLVKTDQYGRFIPHPTTGFAQIVRTAGNNTTLPTYESGTAAEPVDGTRAVRTGHAFLDDIAHFANPSNSQTGAPLPADDNTTVGGAPQTGRYDDELLAQHYITGDGRGNENIGLTAVHAIFHSEHNGSVDRIITLIEQDGGPDPADWKLPDGTYNGERIFQAARFVTEMQYQHLVFEEFARKVQPMVNLFAGYEVDVDPTIVAEFAHTVYRFGHSMLNEKVDRTTVTGADKSMGLIDAFLNPQAFEGTGADRVSPEAAVGDIVRGMTRQVGNEIDEFVTPALRSNLLGLPLDLATINLARGRDTGVPTLNKARKSFFAATSNSALQPYESWTDFKLGIRNQPSVVNFIAAYGKHDSITGTEAQRRAAADLLVNGGAGAPSMPEREAFMDGPAATTGVDDIDFWIGGLAEKQMVFGGLLGSTFNFVFETQMEKLQNGDRFYYLSRTAGLNFLTQLEESSFSELIQRNTDVKHLPFDAFSRPDFIFELGNLGTDGPVLDDPATADVDESKLLTRQNGTIRFAGAEHTVFGGTEGADKMRASEGDDTLWGDGGDDRLEGGDGVDALNGNKGDDIITDLNGDDNIKGGDGNDTISAGPGFDLLLAGAGKDFVIAGSDPKETFSGAGDDFVNAGDDSDTVFGGEGADWIDGGTGADLLQGDNGDPFQEGRLGDDVIMGGGGNDDYDAEGGDDVMVADAGIERSEGMLGFDWVTHRNEPEPVNADMAFTGLLPPDKDAIRDRFDNVEGLSGHNKDDVLRGDDADAAAMVEHELTNTALIENIASVLGTATSFTGGNIILGGNGADTIEGRGGDDIIDGDRWLRVQIAVRTPDDSGEIKRVDNMRDIQAELFAGAIKPGQLRIVRSIETPAAATGTDTAAYAGNRDEYDISTDAAGTTTVVHARPVAVGGGGGGGVLGTGTDTVRNVERLVFADAVFQIAPNASLTPATRAFNDQLVGTTSAAQLATLTNTGNTPLTIASIALAGADAGDFSQTNGCGATLAPSASCTISVRFAPTVLGTRNATLVVTHDANNVAGSTHEIALSGTGAEPVVAASAPASVDFGENRSGIAGLLGADRTIVVRSSGTVPLNIGSVTIAVNSSPANYSIRPGGTCANTTLAPNATCQVVVRFKASGTNGSPEPRNATLRINSDAAAGATNIALTGTATPGLFGREAQEAEGSSTAAAPDSAAQAPAAAPMRAGELTVSRSRTRRLAVSTNVPANARVVQIRVVRLVAVKAKTGSRVRRIPVVTVYRKVTKAGRHTFRLTRKELRSLKPGRYQVVVRVGTSRQTLGPARTQILTVAKGKVKN